MLRTLLYFLVVLAYISHISCDDDDDFAQEVAEALNALEQETTAQVTAFNSKVPTWLKSVSDAQVKSKDADIKKMNNILDAAQNNVTAILNEAATKGESVVACVNQYNKQINKTQLENEINYCFATSYDMINTTIMISQEGITDFAEQIGTFKNDLLFCGKNATCLDDLSGKIDEANSVPEEIKMKIETLDVYVQNTVENQNNACDVEASLSYNIDLMLVLMQQCFYMA